MLRVVKTRSRALLAAISPWEEAADLALTSQDGFCSWVESVACMVLAVRKKRTAESGE